MTADRCTKCTVYYQEYTHRSKGAGLLFFLYFSIRDVCLFLLNVTYTMLSSLLWERCWTKELLNYTAEFS